MAEGTTPIDHYDRILQKTIDRHIPFKVDWELTYRCNLRCRHCYQTGPTTEEELITQEVYSVLDQLAELGCLYITFSGGEMFLRDDFFDIVEYARKKDFALRLFTNGTFVDAVMTRKIKEIAQPVAVEISLYGMDASIHDGITGIPGSFAKTIQAFQCLKNQDVPTVVKTTIMKTNVSEFNKLRSFANANGFRFVFSLTVVPQIDGSKKILNNRLNYKEVEALYDVQPWMKDEITRGGVPVYKPLCAAAFNSLYISPYGEVFPCMLLRGEYSTIRELPLREIWHSSFFQQMRKIQFTDLSECSQCNIAHYCDRCAGLALLESNDLLGPSANDCILAQVRNNIVNPVRA